MPPLIQFSIVVATLALVALTFGALGLLRRLSSLTDSVVIALRQVEEALVRSKANWDRIERALAGVEAFAGVLRGGTRHLTGLVHIATDMASEVLDEVQRPVVRAVAVMRGARAVVNALAERRKHWRRVTISVPVRSHTVQAVYDAS